MVRRDNVEHLLLIGGANDIVVESNIVRAQAAQKPIANARAEMTQAEAIEQPSAQKETSLAMPVAGAAAIGAAGFAAVTSTASSAVDTVTEVTTDAVSSIGETASNVAETVADKTSDIAETVTETVSDTASDTVSVVSNSVETVADNGILNYSISDSENTPDGVYDAYEIDSDNDGCFDSIEEAISDSDEDGLAGTGIPTVSANGLVSATAYSPPIHNRWQNPLVAFCGPEDCTNGVDDDGDGLIDCADEECPGSNSAIRVN